MNEPKILKGLVVKLKNDSSISSDDIDKFTDYWEKLPSNALQLPCPLCYINKDEHSPLIALPEKNGFDVIKCKICKEKYLIPINN